MLHIDEVSHELGIDIAKLSAEWDIRWAIEQERAAGVEFGPMHHAYLLERAPAQVKRILAEMERTRHIGLLASAQGFGDMPYRDFPPANLRAAIASTTTETNLWDPAIHAPLPVGSIRGGKGWTVRFGGVMGTTATPTLVVTTRIGTNNSAPPTGTTLGASATVTLGTITAQPFLGIADYGVRVNGVAASTATVTGNGVYFCPAAAAATVTPHILFGGSVAATTIDETVAQGIGVSVTWGANSSSNTITPQYVKHIADN